MGCAMKFRHGEGHAQQEDEMAQALYASVETARGWEVMLWSSSGSFQSTLPQSCATKEEADRYAKAYLKLFN